LITIHRALCLGGALLLLGSAHADPPGEAVLRALDEQAGRASARTLVRQTITTSGGDQRSFTLRMSTSASEDELLLIYTEPARVRGISFLMLNGRDDTWTFNPKTRRVRKLTSSTRKRKVNGSDFSYEDFGAGAGTMGEDYTADLDGAESLDGVPCDRLVLRPKPGGPSYSKVIAWIGRDPRVLRRADYYDDEGAPLKRLRASEIRMVDGIPIPHDYRMKSLRGDRWTRMEVVELERGVEFPAGTFTLENLRRQ